MKVAVNLLSPKLYYSTIAIDNPSASVTVGPDMTAFIGPNGAGKSLLADILEKGWNFRTNRISCSASSKPVIRKIQFSDIHSLAGLKVEYYQQRYEATANDEVPTVSEVMADKLLTERARELCEIFSLNEAADKKINFLSSGELRKLLIINTLLTDNIDMLILDNPYIGLDREAREVLDSALAELNRKGDLTIVMIVANERDIHPDCTTVVPVLDLQILPPMSRADFMADSELIDSLFDFKINLNDVPLPPVADTARLSHVVKMTDVTIAYGKRTIVDRFNWQIEPGQHWALAGRNGSGKSTLLSLLTADNPKAYSQNVSLFDRRRGSGESIWEVKSRVAMISPELSLHFHPAGTVETIVAQSLNNTNGLFHPLTAEQLELARHWLDRLGLTGLAGRMWATLSAGERQMVLLARVMIKQPRLIILDEPFHGLDRGRMKAIRALIDYIADRSLRSPDEAPVSMIVVSHYAEQLPSSITHKLTLK